MSIAVSAAHTIRFSVFNHAHDNKAKAKALEFAEFTNLLDSPPELVDIPPGATDKQIDEIKEAGEMWSPWIYNGPVRNKEDAKEANSFPLDFDVGSDGKKGLTPEDEDLLFNHFARKKQRYIAHTSFTSGYYHPRRKLRVVLFLDQPIKSVDEYKRFWDAFVADLPIKPDRARRDTGCFFSPRCPREHAHLYESFYDGTELVRVSEYLSPFGDLNSVEFRERVLPLTAEDWAQQLRTTPDQAWKTVNRAAFCLAIKAADPDKDLGAFIDTTWTMCREALEQNPVPTKKWEQKRKACEAGAAAGWTIGLEELKKRPALPENFIPTEKQVAKATAVLKAAIKLVQEDPKQLNNQAYLVGRYTPHVLNADHVVATLANAAAFTTKSKGETAFIELAAATTTAQAGVTNGQKHKHFARAKDGWKGKLRVDEEKGTWTVCDANAKIILKEHPDMVGKLRWNVRDDAPVLVASPPWETSRETFPCVVDVPDGYDASYWMSGPKVIGGKPLPARIAYEAMHAVASEDKFDPFADWLETLVWDKAPRLDTWLSVYGEAADNRYTRLAAKNFLIGSVAITLDPENNAVDTVLVLVGPEHRGKSRLFKALVGEKYFSDSLRDITNKDSLLSMEGLVIMEIAEIDKLMQYDDADVKSFITTRNAKVRPAYARVSRNVVRRAVLAATTNEDEFLKSTTGNRRFVPVRCGVRCEHEKLGQDRGQLWAEALFRYKNGEKWWIENEEDFEEAKKVQDIFRVKDEMEFELSFLDGKRPGWAFDHGTSQSLTEQKRMEVWPEQFDEEGKFLWVTVKQVCEYLHKDWSDLRLQRRAGKALRLKGWNNSKIFRLKSGEMLRVFSCNGL